ncbi:MAG TPA: GNAT family N-acetyltransferase [Actinomycetota bacterium]|nr:GNAT family N-acetyltransferase [Actinomycetota bacterium]
MSAPDPLEQALTAERSACERAGVTIADISDLDGEAAVAALFDRVWGGESVMPANLLRAVTHAGNFLSGAYAEGRMVGASFGFLGGGRDDLHLHSHMTGVDPDLQRRGVGVALKLHQRAWALERGIPRVDWTFDPLVRQNAFLNLMKLGAEIVGYHVNFYGEMPDGINAGDESDRVLVSWDVGSERAARATGEGLAEPDIDAMRAGDVPIALDEDGSGGPVVNETLDGATLLCRVPESIVRVRAQDPGAARSWRLGLRATMGAAIDAGYRATAISRAGYYVLTKETT